MSKITEIISYKHNGMLHRVWQFAYIFKETEDIVILINDRSSVIDGDGRRWKTKEPAVCFFYKKKWFNIICMLRNNSVYYYCNLSSPYVHDEEGIKYIDYDLDVKVFPSGDKIILDRDEFAFNQIDYGYSEELIDIIERQLKNLLMMIDKEETPFNELSVFNIYEQYLAITKTSEKEKEIFSGNKN